MKKERKNHQKNISNLFSFFGNEISLSNYYFKNLFEKKK